MAVLKGLNFTSGALSYAVSKKLLKLNASMVFKTAKVTYALQRMENFKNCLDYVTISVFPQKSKQQQKRYMPWGLYKDRTTPVKSWVRKIL